MLRVNDSIPTDSERLPVYMHRQSYWRATADAREKASASRAGARCPCVSAVRRVGTAIPCATCRPDYDELIEFRLDHERWASHWSEHRDAAVAAVITGDSETSTAPLEWTVAVDAARPSYVVIAFDRGRSAAHANRCAEVAHAIKDALHHEDPALPVSFSAAANTVASWDDADMCTTDAVVEVHVPRPYGEAFAGRRIESSPYAPLALGDDEKLPASHVTPRPFQKRALDAMHQAYEAEMSGGVVTIGTGFGKSVVAMLFSISIGVRVLVVVDAERLAKQWHGDAFGAVPACRRTILQGGVACDTFGRCVRAREAGDASVVVPTVVVATVQTLVTRPDDDALWHAFGLVVYDEAETLIAPQYRRCYTATTAPFRVALTATPHRDDGRDRMFDAYVGPVLYALRSPVRRGMCVYVLRDDAPTWRVRYQPMRGHRRQRGGRAVMQVDRHETNRAAQSDPRRCSKIAELCATFVCHQIKVFVIGSSIAGLSEQARVLRAHEDFADRPTSVGVLHKDVSASERTRIIRDCVVIMATAKMVGKGLDTNARALIIATGGGKGKALKQLLGRIDRSGEGGSTERSFVVDFDDRFAMQRPARYMRRCLGDRMKTYKEVARDKITTRMFDTRFVL